MSPELLRRERKLLVGNSTEEGTALVAYIQSRLQGEENDDSSSEPGLTVFLTRPGYEGVVGTCAQEGYPLDPTQIEEVTPDLFAIRLDRGVYSIVAGGAQFYQEADKDWKTNQKAKKPFALGNHHVIRIEGYANELWQNRYYEWDGTPKRRE